MVCVQEVRGGAEALSIFARERHHKSICGAPLDNSGSGYLDPETLQRGRLDRFYHIMKESDITQESTRWTYERVVQCPIVD